jgi:pimeloyl-ACP methyl ester carboxylesterase
MKAFFFGPASTQLLGIYHAPDPHRDRYQGIVLCYPFGQEYLRAHRAFRQLAASLSRKGFHVLRFDYRGTGDSAGDVTGITADDWLKDIDHAIQELRDTTGVHKVGLMGLRLGALLAGVAGARRSDLNMLVAWDPVLNGAGYLAEVTDQIQRARPAKRRSNYVDAAGHLYFNGFTLAPELQESLCGLDLLQVEPVCGRTLQVVSRETSSSERLRAAWQKLGFDYRHIPAEHDWNYVDHVGGILLPRPVLGEIAEWA